ncbi:MAG: hypothetical protein GWM90_08195, partial [Gemmatimonadetes bacterium]|nr:carbohydrate binding family 9 domain-containing protein [Gemmatimonadota bacterium]NIQ53857.1 carbohydrate binding family 9 domain-containing protein [Gemmatimonadota bacterium]NIU74024.1 hypothetical protein [Gammaproteobacteria bacterium]NIX44092.1 hypothetical protein [Gemmatimonadota bacterium]NIY08307.1 hypothetical protein [Gemmatimonadota bacterium]
MRLDGQLSETAWDRAQPATGFVQREPEEGSPASETTEVRFVYDDAALWIGARMRSDDPSAIRSLVTRRDREGSSEQLVVSLDTYRDRRTAYSFGVTPAGVRIDYYHAADFEGRRDYEYDPVWQVETSVDGGGWTAEIRIPFSQLRFDGAADQVWGVNLARHVPARNEVAYWVLVGRNETGWASRMGELVGVSDVRPSRGVELLPYLAANADMVSGDAEDPFLEERSTALRAGADLKAGIGPSLTLDATINPDFGQVEADPAEVNLTAFETFFSERRPFFTEGSQLFGGRGLFYSRRIGAPPPGTPDADYFETVDNTTILGAGKLTGRLPSGLSVGVLAAVTGEEEVATYDASADEFGTAVVAPTTGYAAASMQQEFGADGSTLSAMVTGVHRSLEPGSDLAGLVTEDAVSGIVDGRYRWAGGKYDVSAYIAATHVRGSAPALLRLQESSRRYWQRPDADHVEVDPNRTTMTGAMMGINHSKMAGEHWLWDIDYYQESPGFEPNDIGALGGADDRGLLGNLRYRDTEPGPLHRAWTLGAGAGSEWTFGGERQYTVIYPFLNWVLPNFWRINLDADFVTGGLSDALTRGGPLMARPAETSFQAEVQNSSGSRTRWGIELEVGDDDAGGRYLRVEPSLSLRPGARWELSLDPRWIDWTDPRQYVTSRDDGPAATFGRRYIFAHVDRSEVAARIRLNYTFTPELTLETYLEPFAASGAYHTFGELEAARSRELRVYGEDGTGITRNGDGSVTVDADGESFTISSRDFNVRSLRSNAVLRWEWRPGSTAYLVWQQDGFGSRDPGEVGPAELFDAFGAAR